MADAVALWRIQLHKAGDRVALFTHNGKGVGADSDELCGNAGIRPAVCGRSAATLVGLCHHGKGRFEQLVSDLRAPWPAAPKIALTSIKA